MDDEPQDKPADDSAPQADDQPAADQPADDQPADDQPTAQPEDKPADDQPTDDQPTDDRPADDRPADDSDQPAQQAGEESAQKSDDQPDISGPDSGVPTPAAEDTGRSFIIEKADLTPAQRAFNPQSRDKSGKIAISVRVPKLPPGGSIRWSVPPSEAGNYTLAGGGTTQSGNRADITGLRPGLTAIDVEARNAGGESEKYKLCIPQFVTVDVDAPAFDPVLASLQLDVNKSDVLQVAKQVCDLLLSGANVRTIWLMPPFSETLPPQFAPGGVAASRVTQAVFRGDPPSHALYGVTNQGAGGIGPNDFDETISVFAGAFDDRVTGNTNEDVDELTNEVVFTLANLGPISSSVRQTGIEIVGRLLGETLAHEIVHSLIGATLTDGFHNAHPGVLHDLMNYGIDRSFQDRTGFELLDRVSTPDFSQLQDHGIGFIDIPTGDSKAQIDAHFPIPPTFG